MGSSITGSWWSAGPRTTRTSGGYPPPRRRPALGHPTEHPGTPFAGPVQAIVPWKCTHLLPELPAEPVRTHHYQAFIMFSGSTTGLVGHDCVPLTAAETTAEGMPIGFANYLAAAAHVDRIATICVAARAGVSGAGAPCWPAPA